MPEFVVNFQESNATFNLNFGEGTVIPGNLTEWNTVMHKPFETIGSGLKVENGALSVDVANAIEPDNMKPVTSAAVYTEVGNIDILLGLI